MFGDPRKHLAQKRFGIEAVQFGAAQQAVESRSSLTAGITAGEQEVLTPKRNAPQRSFRRIVVDLDAPVLTIAPQRLPAGQRIADRFGRRGFLRERLERLLKPNLQSIA